MVNISSGNRFGNLNISGGTFVSNVSTSTDTNNSNISTNPVLRKGDKGDKGDPGFSPLATVTQTPTGATITITDINGTTTTNIDVYYVHEQGIASDTWEINHNLNKFPSVTLVDTAGTQFQGRVEYIDENNCVVYMNGATKGKAYLN